jgi:transport family protein 27
MTILRCKVAIVGDAQVGKTALTTVFHKQGKAFPQNYNMTLGVDFCVKHVKIPNTDTQVELYIFDTSGHEIYKKLRSKYWDGSSMLMVVFDMMNEQSFKNCSKWIEEAKKVLGKGNPNKPIQGILVGAKSDLKDHSLIKYDDAIELANQHGFGYFECSALLSKDVDMPFNFMASTFFGNYQVCELWKSV